MRASKGIGSTTSLDDYNFLEIVSFSHELSKEEKLSCDGFVFAGPASIDEIDPTNCPITYLGEKTQDNYFTLKQLIDRHIDEVKDCHRHVKCLARNTQEYDEYLEKYGEGKNTDQELKTVDRYHLQTLFR